MKRYYQVFDQKAYNTKEMRRYHASMLQQSWSGSYTLPNAQPTILLQVPTSTTYYIDPNYAMRNTAR